MSETTAPMMTVRGLTKEFPGGVTALSGVNLDVAAASIFVLLGPNGAGKSTMVRILNGTLGATSGTCEVAGFGPGDPAVRALSATLTESAHLYEALTCRENLRLFGTLYDLRGKALETRIEDLLETFGLTAARDRAWGACSTGMKKRLQLARALLHDPQILFLDEPTSGLDPEAAEQMVELVLQLRKDQGKTIFLCTHNLPLGQRLGDTFAFLRQGRIVRQGSAHELIEGSWTNRQVRLLTSRGERWEPWTTPDDIASLVQQAVASGERVYEVTPVRPDLGDVYRSVMNMEGGKHAVVSD